MRRRRRYINSNNLDQDFNKSDLVETELIDKVSLWILRIILKLGGHREFIDNRNEFSNDNLAYFLDLNKYVAMDFSNKI